MTGDEIPNAAPEAARLGEALARLRRDRGLSQAEAGARVGMTSQGWGLYEAGRRSGLFRPDVQRRLTSALDSSPEDLALQAALDDGTSAAAAVVTGVESPSRTFRPAPGASRGVQRMQLSDDDLAPWATSGVVLEFDPDRWPRRHQGCVIDRIDGLRIVRLYDRADGDRLFLRGGPGGLETLTVLARSEAVRVAAVIARIEP